MVQFDTDDYFLYLRVPPSENSLLEKYHNATYLKGKRAWRLPLNRHSLREVYKTFPDVHNDSRFIQLGFNLKEQFNRRLKERKFIPTMPNDEVLRPYQWEDIWSLKDAICGGIFNEPRTGKTPTAIRLMRYFGEQRNLVICPASLVLNWKVEFAKWWPECKAYAVDGTPKRRAEMYDRFSDADEPAVLIMSKNTLTNDKDETIFKKMFHTCFVDEAHFLRHYNTAQSKAIFRLKAGRRFALTGTPTINHPADIWGILHFLKPRAYPSYWQFVARYFLLEENLYSSNKIEGEPKDHREQELKESIGLISVQRKRADIMPWLPKKQYQRLTCVMSDKQRKLYKEMSDFFTASDDPHEVDAQNVITQLMRLRQLCLDPRLLGFTEPGSKTRLLLDYLENDRGPIVVMSMFTSYLKMIGPEIAKLNRKVGYIHGQMSNTEKQAAVNEFQSGKIDVLLCNIISAGVGFTLDASSTVLFLDRAFTPAENEQAEDRICPVSEERNHAHHIIDIECADSVDSRINDILSRKKTLTDFINEGGQAAIKQLLGG